MSMHQALKGLQMYPYQVQCVPNLKAPKLPAKWFLKFIQSGIHKLSNVHFTFEECFTPSWYINSQTFRTCLTENPHRYCEKALHLEKLVYGVPFHINKSWDHCSSAAQLTVHHIRTLSCSLLVCQNCQKDDVGFNKLEQLSIHLPQSCLSLKSFLGITWFPKDCGLLKYRLVTSRLFSVELFKERCVQRLPEIHH